LFFIGSLAKEEAHTAEQDSAGEGEQKTVLRPCERFFWRHNFQAFVFWPRMLPLCGCL